MALSPTTSVGGAASSGMSLISDQTLSSPAANMDSSGIPAGFKDLLVVFSGRGDTVAASVTMQLRLNGDTGANYNSGGSSATVAAVNRFSSIGGTAARLGDIAAASATAGMTGTLQTTIADYAGTTFDKQFMSYGSLGVAGDNQAVCSSGIWLNTAAVTQVTIFGGSGNLIAGSRLTVYGIF